MATAASSARALARSCALEAMQPHARPYPSHTHIYIYMYVYNIYICVCVCISVHIFHLSYAQPYLLTWTPAHASAHTLARAHTRRMTAAPHRRPAERVPPAVARRPGREGGAYPLQRGDGRGVPRADVRVERGRRLERLRAEPHKVDADGTHSHASARMRGRPIARAHGRSTQARVCCRPASAIRSSV